MWLWYWYECGECGNIWGSEQDIPSREWCSCNSAEEPELIWEEQVEL